MCQYYSSSSSPQSEADDIYRYRCAMDCPADAVIPPLVDETTAEELLGDRFDKKRFMSLANEGKITREALMAQLNRIDVYVSHEMEAERVRRVTQALKEKGLVTCFQDTDSASEENLMSSIRKGIDNCLCVVIFLSKGYVSRVESCDAMNPCKLEFTYAAREKTVSSIIPVVIDTELCASPEEWVGDIGRVLSGRRIVDMTGDVDNTAYLEDRTEELYTRVMAVIQRSTEVPEKQEETTQPSHSGQIADGGVKALRDLSSEDVGYVLDHLNLSNYKAIFKSNQVDGECLALCDSPEELRELGILLLPKARVLFARLSGYKISGVPVSILKSTDESPTKRSTTFRPSADIIGTCSIGILRLQPLRVSGCSGDRAHDINGIYDPVEEICDNFCRYIKRGGQNNWMEYNSTRGHWHIKKAESKGTVNAWAYAVSGCVSPDLITTPWHVFNGTEFPEQPNMKVCRVYESILVRGATGTCTQQVNGVFDPTNEECGGWIRYRKRGGQDCWMEYSEVRGQWHIKPSASKNSTNAWAYMVCKPVCSPDKQKGTPWHLYDGSRFDKQDNVIAIAEPIPICIRGAVGSCMHQVNGVFDPCDEVYGGFVRYRKRGGQDCWMEYNEQRKQWHIKPDASKATTNAWAYAVYNTPIAPQKKKSVWHLYDGALFDKQPDVVVMPELKPIVVSGAVGNVAPQVNGVFDPTDELCNGWVRYKKRGGQDCWMEYMEAKGQWHIKPSASKNSTNAWAYATCRPVCAPQDIGDIWRLYDGSKFEDHLSVKVTVEDDDNERDLARWLRNIQVSAPTTG